MSYKALHDPGPCSLPNLVSPLSHPTAVTVTFSLITEYAELVSLHLILHGWQFFRSQLKCHLLREAAPFFMAFITL